MLTLELVRARSRKGELKPLYIDPGDPELLELAGDLIEVFRFHVGRPYGELKEAVKAAVGEGDDALLAKGLARLLESRCQIDVESQLDPREVRRRLFEAAAEHHPVAGKAMLDRPGRGDVLARVAGELGVTPEQLEAAMYADLPDAHMVQSADLPEPRWLLERYNVALAQALLLRAGSMRITIAGSSAARFRQLFRYIKFFRLMHHVEPLEKGGYAIQLDGPLSLFKLSHKYGLQLAELLPALLLCQGWELEAEVEWGVRRELRKLRLSPKDGLKSHYPDTGVYETREERWFLERFEVCKTEWKLDREPRVLPLGGQGVVVPDFALRHPDGRVAWLEIVGFWRRSYLEKRLALYREYGPGNLILAVSRQLQGSLEGLEGFEGEVYTFREIIVAKDIVERAEKVGRVEQGG